ncbi:MAG: DAK2 domain-containing protein [Acutalibacteraceae bacterium]|jgi:DAK2 domain fusion protein YloV
MAFRRIDGLQLEKMLVNGLAYLIAQEEAVNKLNVFPVPDGDTGTNMRKTLENGLRMARKAPETGVFLRGLSEGMLLGARGNSGVILSQFFHGFAAELSRSAYIGPGEMRSGLIRGYRTAYQAVVHPVEGTILSVAREGIEHIRGQITRTTSIDSILAMYVAEMKRTLSRTPEMLPVLKEAGVVDSGAMGFILIVEGMLQFLYGKILPYEGRAARPKTESAPPDKALFHENSRFEDGYCMEFILQLMTADPYDQRFRLQAFIADLELYGNSIVAVQNGKRVKVHIHTLRPEKVMTLARSFGEFLTFKLDNMQIQHNEHIRRQQKPAKKKPLSVIAVVSGDGQKTLFTDLGCECVIDGGTTMNTSSQEFIDAFSRLNAEAIVVLPNHPNVVLAARQAVELTGAKNVTVLATKSVAEGYYALAMDVADSPDTGYRIRQMRQGAQNVVTLEQTAASRDFTYHGLRCAKGDEILLLNHELVCVNSDKVAAVLEGLALVEDIDQRESGLLLRGKGASEEEQDALLDAIRERYPLLEIEPVDGGQEIYHWIVGIS